MIIIAKRRKKIATEYLNKFRKFSNKYVSGAFDGDLYDWLIINSVKIPKKLNGFLLIFQKQPDFLKLKVNYQLIHDTLLEMKEGKATSNKISTSDDILLQYIGIIENATTQLLKKLINPFIWFRESVKQILLLPYLVMNWLDLISSETTGRIAVNYLFRAIAAVITIIYLVSSIMIIIMGWERFYQIVDTVEINIPK